MNLNRKNFTSVSRTIYPRGEHGISRSRIDPDALKIMYRLMDHGYKAYMVGGGVRDLLLGKAPKDFDISTDATPNQIRSLFRNCRIIGRRFKLAHIFFRDNKIIEVSTFRDVSATVEADTEDTEAPAVKSDNTYGTESTDAWRRDITINALFYDLATFSVIDYVGGVEDLQKKIIRVIGDPEERYREDPIRMMRVVRHAARAGFTIEEKSRRALERHGVLIRKCPPVRIYVELVKDLTSGYAAKILRMLGECGLLDHIIPELVAHEQSLLRQDSQFALCLERADELIKNKHEISLTAILSLLTLFSGTDNILLGQLKHRFIDKTELQNHVASVFPELALPRKERERIEKVLLNWHALELSHPDEFRPQQLGRRQNFPDVAQLFSVLYPEPHHPLVTLCQEALRFHSPEKRRSRRQQQPRRR